MAKLQPQQKENTPNQDGKFLLVIDANAIIHRAYHAYPPTLTTSSGLQVNAVYGFTAMLLGVLERFDPNYILCAFDTKKPTFRHKEYPAYKATRKPTDQSLIAQFPLVEDVLNAFNIPILKADGYEADDIIGTVLERVSAGKWSGQNLHVVVVTGDKDLLQLIDENTLVALPQGGFKTLTAYNREMTYKKYGYYPEQVVDFKGMAGDNSDNLPGIKGVGEKSALELLNKHKDWAGIYSNLDELTEHKRRLFVEGLEQGEFTRKLATVKRDVPINVALEDCLLRDFDKQNVLELFIRFQFRSLVNKIPKSLADQHKQSVKAGQLGLFGDISEKIKENDRQGEKTPDVGADGGDQNFSGMTKIVSLKEMNKLIGNKTFLTCCYLEENGLLFVRARTDLPKDVSEFVECTVSLLGDTNNALGEGLFELEGLSSIWFGFEEFISAICGIYPRGYTGGLSCGNLGKYVYDIQLASHMLSAGEKKYTLQMLAFRELGMILSEKLSTQDRTLCLDLVEKLDLAIKKKLVVNVDKQSDFIKKNWQTVVKSGGDLSKLYLEFSENVSSSKSAKVPDVTAEKLWSSVQYQSLLCLDVPVSLILAKMENHGVLVKYDKLLQLEEELSDLVEAERQAIFKSIGHEFNPDSPKQLAELLYDELGIDPVSRGKRGRSTREQNLQQLIDHHPVVPQILKYRELTKVLRTYVTSYIDELRPLVEAGENPVIRSNFLQTGTATGRLSSRNPNLQNIPTRGEWSEKVRSLFVPRKGFQFLSIDYSQIESRLMAEFSGDKVLIQEFVEGKDIHAMTASHIFGVSESEVTAEQRAVGKTVNFGVLYGQTAFGLSSGLGISRGDAARYIASYFEKYVGVSAYIDKVGGRVDECGYVESMFGRRRYIAGLSSHNKWVRSGAIREAVNMPLQGSASDLMKLAMLGSDRLISKEFNGQAVLILQVHDELLFEVRDTVIQQFTDQMSELMRTVMEFKVPLEVHCSVGNSLADV